MARDIQRHSMDLLEWLYDHPDENASAFRGGLASNDELRDLVRYLADRHLIKDLTTFGGPDAETLPDGSALVQRLRAARAAPAQRANRASAVRTHLLWWLDAQQTPR